MYTVTKSKEVMLIVNAEIDKKLFFYVILIIGEEDTAVSVADASADASASSFASSKDSCNSS